MTIDQLNVDYGITNRVTFEEGKGGLPFIVIKNHSATALIALHGEQILSYKPKVEVADMLFLSPLSNFQDGKAIRGGIPICWPWFGPDPKGIQRPNHGFVRNHLWTVLDTETTDIDTQVTLQFKESYKKEKTWKQPFALNLQISVGKTLSLKLTTFNTGDKPFSITQAFHSYFHVSDITQVQILGLEGADYYDKLDQGTQKNQDGVLIINEEIDRIYTGVKHSLWIKDPAFKRRIKINSPGNETVVVWNPWIKRSKKISDLKNQSYKHFVCVETGNIAFDLINIPPGTEYTLFTNFQAVVD